MVGRKSGEQMVGLASGGGPVFLVWEREWVRGEESAQRPGVCGGLCLVGDHRDDGFVPSLLEWGASEVEVSLGLVVLALSGAPALDYCATDFSE